MLRVSILHFLPLMLVSLLTLPGAAAAVDVPLASVNGQSITQKDLDKALLGDYRDAALDHLVMQMLIDQQAQKAGVTVSDAYVDNLIATWKAEKFGGSEILYRVELAKQGLTPSLYRQVIRDGIIAQQIISRTTHLEDKDFDKIEVERLVVRSAEQAQAVYTALARGVGLAAVQQQFQVELVGPVSLFRYNGYMDPGDFATAYTLTKGQFTRPILSLDPSGYQVLILSQQRPGFTLSSADRQIWQNGLLQHKINFMVQEWWTNLEKQVMAVRAAGSTALPASQGAGSPPVERAQGGTAPNNSSQPPASGGANPDVIVLPPPQ